MNVWLRIVITGNKMNIEKLKEDVKKGLLILMRKQKYEEYIDDLEDKLEDAKNSLAGADDIIPEAIIELITTDGTVISLQGKKELLDNW
jgi:hypothetical protein